MSNEFKYYEGMTFKEMEDKILSIIEYMKTDEYWLKYGHDEPPVELTNNILEHYLEMTDDMNIPRHKTLKEAWWYQLKCNLAKGRVINRTTTDTVKVVMLSGREIIFSIAPYLLHIDDIFWQLPPDLEDTHGDDLTLLDGERILHWSSRIIVTDETELTLIIGPREHESDEEM